MLVSGGSERINQFDLKMLRKALQPLDNEVNNTFHLFKIIPSIKFVIYLQLKLYFANEIASLQ